MKKKLFKTSTYGIVVILLLFQSSCKKNYSNPNAAGNGEAFSSPAGLTGVANGLQRIYTAGRGSNLYNRVTINGLVTSFPPTTASKVILFNKMAVLSIMFTDTSWISAFL